MSFDLDKCVVDENMSLREALKKIDENHYGFVFSCNMDKDITGLATDGDIRRGLINGISLDGAISSCSNPDFLRASVDSSREQLIKQLDSHIRFIPVFDRNKKLIYMKN